MLLRLLGWKKLFDGAQIAGCLQYLLFQIGRARLQIVEVVARIFEVATTDHTFLQELAIKFDFFSLLLDALLMVIQARLRPGSLILQFDLQFLQRILRHELEIRGNSAGCAA